MRKQNVDVGIEVDTETWTISDYTGAITVGLGEIIRVDSFEGRRVTFWSNVE